MEAKHTPGPWKIFDEGDHFPGIDADEMTIILWGNEDENVGVQGHSKDERLANARLIAAAPELLECLVWAMREGRLSYSARTSSNRAHCDAIDRAKAVIAKATGA